MFWRSVDLTGNQTKEFGFRNPIMFWRSVDLTGNQTRHRYRRLGEQFWRSVDLTGNQTAAHEHEDAVGFGAVSI